MIRTIAVLFVVGFVFTASGAFASDRDGDGIADASDNCTETANPDQTDGDGDGYGNACDADYNNDGVVDDADYAILTDAFGSDSDHVADHNNDGRVLADDMTLHAVIKQGGVGPSGLACADPSGVTAPCTN